MSIDCKGSANCGEKATKNECETFAQEFLHSFRACQWGKNVYGSYECRADFANVAAVRCPTTNIIVLTKSRPLHLSRLLKTLADSFYDGDTPELTIRIDGSHRPTSKAATRMKWPHGAKHVTTTSVGSLQQAWYSSWVPRHDQDYAVIFEDDITVSPLWYRFLVRAWSRYGNRTDLAGISLQRQTLTPTSNVRGDIGRETDGTPFMYSMVGSIGFSPHPRVWRQFLEWFKGVGASFDPQTPGLITYEWWKTGRKGHMWTQHFIYYCKAHDLYTMYVNPPMGQALASHHRAKGVHFNNEEGQEHALSRSPSWNFLYEPRKYTWSNTRITPISLDRSRLVVAGTIRDADPTNTLLKAKKFCTAARGCEYVIGFHSDEDAKLMRSVLSKATLTLIKDKFDSEIRTTRIAGSRNLIVEYVVENYRSFDYVLWTDLDGPTTFEPSVDLQRVFRKSRSWDVVSFSSSHYYDLWALRCPGKTENCWARSPHTCKRCLYKCLDQIPKDGLLEVDSAFNGLSIYKMDAILSGCRYDISGMDCEHVQYHLCLKSKGFRIRLSSENHIVNATAVIDHLEATRCV